MKKAEKYINFENVLDIGKLKTTENQNVQKNTTQTKNDKSTKLDERSTYKARPKYDEYSPLIASRGRILNEIMNVVLKEVSLDVSKLLSIGNDKKG